MTTWQRGDDCYMKWSEWPRPHGRAIPMIYIRRVRGDPSIALVRTEWGSMTVEVRRLHRCEADARNDTGLR